MEVFEKQYMMFLVFLYEDYDFRLTLSRVIVHLTFSSRVYSDHNTRMLINFIKSCN